MRIPFPNHILLGGVGGQQGIKMRRTGKRNCDQYYEHGKRLEVDTSPDRQRQRAHSPCPSPFLEFCIVFSLRLYVIFSN